MQHVHNTAMAVSKRKASVNIEKCEGHTSTVTEGADGYNLPFHLHYTKF
jgi:hypothetical protein